MMENDKCPWCCAEQPEEEDNRYWYKCGTSVTCPERRHVACYERQLARMKPVVDAAMAWHKLSGNSGELIWEIEKYKEVE